MSRRRLAAIISAVLAGAAVMFGVQHAAFAATNLALGKSVSVSSSDDATANAPSYATDGNTGTRWSSAYSDPQWITVDLGSTQSVGSVTLRWETAYGKAFTIQTSSDNAGWTDRVAVSNGTGGVQTLTFSAVSARYVRMNGTQRGTQWGYSLWEFEVYAPAGTPTTNIAKNKPVSVSSSDDATANAPGYAVDGNTGTRWSSAYSDPQWITVDLGAGATVNSVTLRWETAYGKAFKIQTSDDNAGWTDRATVTNGTGGNQTLSIGSVSARYIRMYGTQRGTAWGYSLWEFEVYGSGGSQPSPTPTGSSGGPDLTGFSLSRDYEFGTGTGRNTSDLSGAFVPYSNLTGQTVINNEWQRYQNFNATNHHVTSNRLELTATPNLGGVTPGGISSGQIVTKETFYPRNGKTYVFALRAKVPHGTGDWPAFWLYAASDPHTASEIDIFEFFDSPTQNSFDWTGYDHGDGVGSDYHNIMTNQWVWHPGFDFAADYHTYYLVWKEGDIQKWVDNNWVKGTNFTWNGSDPQVLINLAIGGDPNNAPTSATFPAVFSIDSFKVYVK